MNPAPSNSQDNYISLQQTAQILSVPVETLLQWNDNNILKPTITATGQVGYRTEQINQFLEIKRVTQNTHIPKIEPVVSIPAPLKTTPRHFSYMPVFAFVLSFSATIIAFTPILNSITDEPPASGISLAPQISEGLIDTSPDLVTLNIIKASASANIAKLDNSLNVGNLVTLAEAANYVPDQKTSDSIFNTDGSIKGSTPNTDVLAAAISAGGITQDNNPVVQNINFNILLALAVLGLLAIPLFFKTQFALLPKSQSELHTSPASGIPADQKILEVNQKADGTIVLCLDNQEFKVSKPELDSESDQFIERLMGLVPPGIKEIDYDSNSDINIKLSAPLSKLVTRLGFVGLKRDLFFPRTSKNRVLFRKYLTLEDLASMNLDLHQISQTFRTT